MGLDSSHGAERRPSPPAPGRGRKGLGADAGWRPSEGGADSEGFGTPSEARRAVSW